MQNIKHNSIQKSNAENKLDKLDFSGVSEIHDLRFENEFDRTKCFSCIIAIIYAISLVILGLSLIFSPAAISIYITLFVLFVIPIAIALYCKKQNAQEDKQDAETSDLVDENEILNEENDQFENNKILTNSAIYEINNTNLLSNDGEVLYQKFEEDLKPQFYDFVYELKIEMNIKQILKLALYFFIFALIGVAVNLIFLQTIFIYISLSILAIIIFSVGYKIHKINSQIKNLNDVNYSDDYSDDIVDIKKLILGKNTESQDKTIAQENTEISKIKI